MKIRRGRAFRPLFLEKNIWIDIYYLVLEKVEMEIVEELMNMISDSEKLLIGIGEDAKMSLDDYAKLYILLDGKDYQIVDISSDNSIRESQLDKERIVCPVAENDEEQWENYLKWLQGTINKNLVLLELGVGFKYPDVIRFPFEKTTFYNLKSHMFRINDMFYQLTPEIKERGSSVKMDVHSFLQSL